MNTLKKVLYSISFIFLSYFLLAFFLLPYFAKKELESKLDKLLVTKTKIEKIFFNPFTLELELENFSLSKEEEILVSFNSLKLDLALFKSLEKAHLRLDDIILDGIYLNIKEEEKGVFNLAKLLKEDAEEKQDKQKEEKNKALAYLVSKIVLKNAFIDFTSFKDDEKYSLNLKDINYTIYDFGTYKNSLSSNNLEFTLNDNTYINISGGARLEPFSAYGQIDIKDLRLLDILNFDKSLFNFDINKEANINLLVNYNLYFDENLNLNLYSNLLEVNNLKVFQKKEKIASLDKLDIKNFSFDLASQSINMQDISFKALDINMLIDESGINFAKLINTKEEEKKDEISKPWTLDISKLNLDINYKLNNKTNDSIIKVKNLALNIANINIINDKINLKDANLGSSNINYLDKKNNFYINLDETKINLDKFSSIESKTKLSNIQIFNKTLAFDENNLNTKISTNNINLSLSNLDFSKDILFDKAKLKVAQLSLKEESKISLDSQNLLLEANKFSFDKNNHLFLENIKLLDIKANFIDENNNLDFNLDEAKINLSKFSYKDESLKIASLELADTNFDLIKLDSNLKIKAKDINIKVDEILNEAKLLKTGKTKIEKPSLSIILAKREEKEEKLKQEENKKDKEASDFKLDLGAFSIVNMNLYFEDNNLQIPFKSEISKLNGEISELRTYENLPSKLDIKGVVDNYGLASIKAKLSPEDIKFLTDINMNFKNISMNNFTPYTAKFVGRKIDEGKLDLDLYYNIKDSNLKAKNGIIIKKIKLGESVKSPEAMSLPLDLAITLLEDSSNTIDINLPVSGNLEDPQFSIAAIVWKAFMNLMTKVISSPFSLLASLFNFSEDDINSVDFELKKAEIEPIQKEVLDKIALILKSKDDLAISFSPAFQDKKEDENTAKLRVNNIKEYLINEKKLAKKQIKIKENIDNTSSNIKLNIEPIK